MFIMAKTVNTQTTFSQYSKYLWLVTVIKSDMK